MSSETTYKPYAMWTNDCQGKKDFDGPIISISSRYWPRGGGISVLRPGSIELETNADQTIRPSAKSSVILHIGPREEDDGGGDSVDLCSEDFEAETQEEVQAMVEAWADRKANEVADILLKHFGITR